MQQSFCRFTVTAMQSMANDHGKTSEALRECVCRTYLRASLLVEIIQMYQTESGILYQHYGKGLNWVLDDWKIKFIVFL